MKKMLTCICVMVTLVSLVTITAYAADANLSVYATVVEDGRNASGYTPDLAIDGNPATRWAAATEVEAFSIEKGSIVKEDCYIGIEFKEKAQISSAKILWETQYALKDGYKIQYSDDGNKWTDVKSPQYTYGDRGKRDAAGWPDANTEVKGPIVDEIKFTKVSAKYFRVFITTGGTLHGPGSIYELEFYGDDAQIETVKTRTPTQTAAPATSSQVVSPTASEAAADNTNTPTPAVTVTSTPVSSTAGTDSNMSIILVVGIAIAVVAVIAIVVIIIVISMKKKDNTN